MESLARMEIEAAPVETSEGLLVAHREGDPDAFAELVQRYRRPVFGYLVRTGVPAEDRDDLFQDIFIKIHRQAHRYDATAPLHPWLFTVVANTVRSYFRKQRLRRLFVWEVPGDGEGAVKDPAPDHEAVVSAKQTSEWLEKAILGLPLRQREAFVLGVLESLPLKDVASALGLPLGTVKTHIRRARLRLADAYERRTRAHHD